MNDFVKKNLTVPKDVHILVAYSYLIHLMVRLSGGQEEGIMECNKEKNLEKCNCTYEPCPRKGVCCECITYHLKMRQLPGCCFPANAEATYDRSYEHFARLVREKRM